MANELAINVREMFGLCDTVSDLNAKLSSIITEINTALTQINAIEGESAAQNRVICQKLQYTTAKAQSYNVMVGNLSTIANQERIATINEMLQSQPPNQEPLRDYIRELEQRISQVQHRYTEFSAACTTAIDLTNDAVETNEAKAIGARTKKRAARVVGGTATSAIIAVGVGTGITLSVIAGVFTFGVGTIVGLSVTAAGTAAAGIGFGGVSAAVTAHIASDYEETETAFRRLKEIVASLQAIRTEMQQAVQSLHRKVEVIEADIGIVKNSMDNQGSPNYPMSHLNENLGRLDSQPNLDQISQRED